MKNKTQISSITQTSTQNLEFALSDASAIANAALEQALNFCAEKMALNGRQAALEHLQASDRMAYSYFNYKLAEQAAEWLGTWDEDIKAVYIFDYDATPEDVCFGEATQPEILHLIVWTRRKTSALSSLLEALNRALAQSCSDLTGKSELMVTLDPHPVDDDDVQNSIDCAAMLSSLHTRPLRIWER